LDRYPEFRVDLVGMESLEALVIDVHLAVLRECQWRKVH
jgi:hypothetical protein